VLDAVRKQSRTAHALMLSSQIESLEGNVLTLAFSSASLADRFARDVSAIVVDALKEVVGVEVKITATAGGSAAPKPAATASERPAAPAPVAEITPDEIEESDDLEGSTDAVDPEAAALALLQDGLGAQVIGEIDQS
jgi:hypothetical protein